MSAMEDTWLPLSDSRLWNPVSVKLTKFVSVFLTGYINPSGGCRGKRTETVCILLLELKVKNRRRKIVSLVNLR